MNKWLLEDFKEDLAKLQEFFVSEKDFQSGKFVITKNDRPLLVVRDFNFIYGGLVLPDGSVSLVGEFLCTTFSNERIVELSSARVDYKYQGIGIAHYLMNELMEYANKIHCDTVILDSVKDKVGLYSHLGFTNDPDRTHKTCVPMCKQVAKIKKAPKIESTILYEHDRKQMALIKKYNAKLQAIIDQNLENEM